MTLLEKVDSFLVEERDNRDKRLRSGLWSPSSFGRCYRHQYWNRANELKSNPIKAETLRVFRIGNLIHDFFQSILKSEYQCEVMIKTNDTLGYADLVNVDEVVDIKSVRSFQFNLMKGIRDKKNKYKVILYNFKKEKTCEILQVSWYGLNLGKSKGRLVFVNKDSMDTVEYEFRIKDFEKELQEELDTLNGFWNTKKLPPALPRCYNGKECEYCVFQTKCQGI